MLRRLKFSTLKPTLAMSHSDGRLWNAYGGITALLEDGDLLIGGIFAVKRVNVCGSS